MLLKIPLILLANMSHCNLSSAFITRLIFKNKYIIDTNPKMNGPEATDKRILLTGATGYVRRPATQTTGKLWIHRPMFHTQGILTPITGVGENGSLWRRCLGWGKAWYGRWKVCMPHIILFTRWVLLDILKTRTEERLNSLLLQHFPAC